MEEQSSIITGLEAERLKNLVDKYLLLKQKADNDGSTGTGKTDSELLGPV